MAFSSYLWYLIEHYQFCGSLLVNRLFRVQKHSKIISFWLGWSVFPDQACDRDRNIADYWWLIEDLSRHCRRGLPAVQR